MRLSALYKQIKASGVDVCLLLQTTTPDLFDLLEPVNAKPPYARLKLATPDAPHDFPEPERQDAYEWLDGLLK